MAGNKLIFKNAEAARNAIMASQKKEIAKLYKDWADEIGERAKYYSRKSTASAPISERYYRELQKQLRATSQEISNEIYRKIRTNIYTVANAVIADNVKWLADFGFPIDGLNAAFSYVPDEIVRNLITGQIYESGWSLSSRIWSDNEQTLKDIYRIMARGLAENKPIYEIAKDLESYVRPSARLPWNLRMKDGVKIYKKQVDYNAQRLARTLVQHGYQQSLIAATHKNPFITEYIWHSNGSRACPLCMDRDGMVFKKGELPMDHPNGMCIIEPVVADNMIDQLADWFNSPDGTYPEIDEFAKDFGYIAKPVSAQFDSAAWHEAMKKQDLRIMESWCEDWLKVISPEERDSIEIYTMSAYYDMNSYLRGQTSFTYYMNEIKHVTAALEKASLPEDVIVRRGSDYNILTELGIDISEANKDKLIGAIVTDKGFLSTSPDPRGGFSRRAIEYIIKIPKGSQAMYIDPISVNRGEKEILINRGGKYIIEDVEFIEVNNRSYVNKIYMTLKNLKSSK